MKSLQNFKTNNSEFFNSAQGRIENPVLIGESLLVQRGSDIDSIFHKMSIYEYRQTHGSFIHESYKNVDFSLNEQFAARDMLINIAENYAQTLCDNFCEEYEINEAFSWQDIKNGTAKFVTNIANTAKEYKDQLTDGLNELKTKKYNNVLVVAHSGVSKAFYGYFNGIPEDGKFLKLGLKNGEIAEYEL